MKKYITIFSLTVLTAVIGCETERVIFKGPYFVRFTNDAAAQKESHSRPIPIEVHLGGPAQTEDVVISYAISGDARKGVDYTIANEGQVTIKKGEYFGDIELQLINNSNNILRKQDVIFTLETVSTNKLQVGQGESAIGNTFTFTINDDCVLGGDYIGTKSSTSVGGITITSTDCQNYTLSNFNIDIDQSIYPYGDALSLTFVDNGDNTLTIPSQENASLDTDHQTISGSGTVDPITRVIIMTVVFEDYDGKPTEQFTLLPN